ncbi:MAG: single-stranded-DNA-specific exonuclease RecJ, partial [Alphaproteobacteria bacterium]|nr:single-stranded-DNA-specific exonuclease RecJ [Alphaproteobacteria bacterium]
ARGIDAELGPRFLKPTLRDHLIDPSRLQDADAGAARLVAAIKKGEGIAVFGDYDVDGATSSALLARYFAAIGVPLRVYIPDRIVEGYGPNGPALRRLRAEGISLVITVDCGITAFDALADAADAGLDVIVVDHHMAEPKLPAAVAVVNPNRLDDDSGQGHLAAVGVTFMLLVALNRAAREADLFTEHDEPDLRQLLDLVALGTVCDVVPLTGLNRAFVTQGLEIMNRRGNIGLAALSDVAGVNERPTAYHLGFMLGPRVNAGGRVGEAGLGAQLLMSRDEAEAAEMAQRLDGFNRERREIESQIVDEAMEQVAAEAVKGTRRGLVFAAGELWHPGVIGIVAGRLKQKYGLPALVIGLEGEVGKGSGRSIEGVDLGSAVIAARQQGLLVNGGGHAMAAGLTVARDKVASLRAFLDQRISGEIEAKALVPSLNIDGSVTVGGAGLDFCNALLDLEPFGAGNPEPRFVIAQSRIAHADVVGKDHVRLSITDGTAKRMKAIAFRAVGEPLGQALLNNMGRPLHLAGKLRRDTWRDRDEVQLIVDDAAWC